MLTCVSVCSDPRAARHTKLQSGQRHGARWGGPQAARPKKLQIGKRHGRASWLLQSDQQAVGKKMRGSDRKALGAAGRCERRDTKIRMLGAAGRCEHRSAKIKSRLYEHRPQRISLARGGNSRAVALLVYGLFDMRKF